MTNNCKERVLALLTEYGPITSKEAAELLETPRSTVASALSILAGKNRVTHDEITGKYALVPQAQRISLAEADTCVTLSGLQVVTIRALVPKPSSDTPLDSLPNIIRHILARRLSHKIKWEEASTETVKLNPQLRDIE